MTRATKKDDNTSQPLGEGFITLSTSAGNALVFRDPSSANAYRIANPAQFNQNSHGEYNKTEQNPS